MSGPTFGGGVVFAALAAAGTATVLTALEGLWPADALLAAAGALAAGAYVLCVVARGRPGAGRVVMPLAWLGMTLVVATLSPGLVSWLAVQAFAISAVRTFVHHRGALAALLDFALSALALLAAVAAVRAGGGVLLSVWTFFLVQALYVFIPRRWTPRTATDDPVARFAAAHLRATRALERLRTTR